MRTWITAAALGAALWSAPAAAQATRTWVSGVGDDVNPCNRTAPCKTFAGALSKTATGGEINCYDPGGFGIVTITRSVSIVCDGMPAYIDSTNANAITINGAGIRVLISGLDINGFGKGSTGVRVIAAGSVVVRNTIIQGMTGTPGVGVSVEGQADVAVLSSTILGNTAGIANPAGTTVRVGNTLIRGNVNGVGPDIGSFGTNQLDGNTTDGKFEEEVPQS